MASVSIRAPPKQDEIKPKVRNKCDCCGLFSTQSANNPNPKRQSNLKQALAMCIFESSSITQTFYV